VGDISIMLDDIALLCTRKTLFLGEAYGFKVSEQYIAAL
jgi:hypothetical protein